MHRLPLSGLFFVAVIALVGCDTGTPQYWGIAPQRVTANGIDFDVRVRGDRAEALRRTMLAFPKDEEVAQAAALAIAQVAGCRVAELKGDPSIIEAALDCAGAPPASPPSSSSLRCEGEIVARTSLELEEITLDCK